MVARLKLKGIDGGSHKRWSMWLNSRQREEPYLPLTYSEFHRDMEVPLILASSREVGVCGTSGGAVKCVDIRRNAGGESDVLDLF